MKTVQRLFYWLSGAAYDLSRWFDQVGYRAAPTPQLTSEQRMQLITSLANHMEQHVLLAAHHEIAADAAEHIKTHLESL